ncbi:MAG: hypothetical protein CVT90_01485 [Candidatus Altiarchaeales archaeon HGW-Altiarchaeales-3]|nr:MAG: hypothetical protein CVT90_01485 [Candidatus Altiarchaeales archaeon HGW-Altiarchaeales-3]
MSDIPEINDIPGIGEKRKRNLLKCFGSVEKIRGASVDELARVPTITRGVAEQIKRYFNRKDKN